MFVKDKMWIPRKEVKGERKKFLKVTKHCEDKTYPKNMVVYTGELHTKFCKEFIGNYFKGSDEKLKINEEARYGRCLKLEYLPFIEK